MLELLSSLLQAKENKANNMYRHFFCITVKLVNSGL